MNSSAKLLLILLLFAGLGAAAYFALSDPNTSANLDPTTGNNQGSDPQAGNNKPDLVAKTGDGEETETSPREEGERERIENKKPAGANFEQGAFGLVVNEAGVPVVGAKVYLVRGTDEDFLRMYKEYQKGVRFPPLAETETDEFGNYRLGLEVWKDRKAHNIHVTHPDYYDQKIAGIQFQPQSWQEFDKIVLKAGAVIRGQVTSEQGIPLADVEINAEQEHGQFHMVAVPGREQGWSTKTDATGSYTLPRLDPTSAYKVTAKAPQFALETKAGVRFSGRDTQEVDFRLAPGLTIAGQVFDTDGQPIPGADITLGALSRTNNFQTKVLGDREGRFTVANLKAGPYNIVAVAQGYQKAEESPIQAGNTEVPIVLERQGAVQVTVLDSRGQPIANYHANVRSAFKGQQGFSHPVAQKSVKGAKNGTELIEGINPGSYAVEVYADGFAKNISETFEMAQSSTAPVQVTVRMNQGGKIVGKVVDAQGKGIAGATITTRPNKFFDNPFVRMFNPPMTISKSTVKSGPDGSFVAERLYPFAYQLHITQPSFCATSLNDIMVQEGQTSDVGSIQMFRGCVISGVATFDGKPQGQIKISVSAKSDPNNPVHFSAEAVTDHEGKFLINKRLPPGNYEIMGGLVVQQNPLVTILQMNKSKQEFSVRQGETERRVDMHIKKLE